MFEMISQFISSQLSSSFMYCSSEDVNLFKGVLRIFSAKLEGARNFSAKSERGYENFTKNLQMSVTLSLARINDSPKN